MQILSKYNNDSNSINNILYYELFSLRNFSLYTQMKINLKEILLSVFW